MLGKGAGGARRGLLWGTCRVAMHCGTVPVFFTVKLRMWHVLIVGLKGVSCTGSHNFGWPKESSLSMESSVCRVVRHCCL